MQGGHGSVMPGVHGLEHVDRLTPTAFPHHYSVRPHAQGVLDQVPDGNLPTPLVVPLPGLHGHHMGLVDLKFSGILDGHHPLLVGDESCDRIQEGSLSRPGPPGNDDVPPVYHGRLQEIPGSRRDGAIFFNQITHRDPLFGKTANRQAGSLQCQRRHHRVHPAAIGHAGIQKRLGLRNLAFGLRRDLVDDRQRVGQESSAGILQHPVLLDEYRVGIDHHDLIDGGVVQKLLQWSEAEPEVLDFFLQPAVAQVTPHGKQRRPVPPAQQVLPQFPEPFAHGRHL